MERMDQIVIENDKVRLELLKDKSDNVKKFSIFGIFGNQMEPFMDLGSNLGLFLGRVKRNGEEKTGIDFKFNKKSKDGKDSCLEFSSMDTNFEIKLIIRLKDNESKDVKIVPLDIIEFIADIVVKNKVTASFLRFDLHYPFKKPLDFVKVPHLRPKKYYIMGDHKLGTPAIILSKNNKSVSLIADVNNFLENRRYMMHMDMNHMDNGRISYGFRNYRSHSHVMFLSKPRKKLKFDPADKKDFKLSFFVRVNADESKEKTLREVTKFLWDYFGKPKLKTILPQTLPFEQFATYNFDSFINPSTFNGYREFEYNNEKCAGLIYRTGTGGSRGRFIKISSEEVENLIKHPIYDHWHIFFAFHTLMNYPWIQNIIGKGVQKNPAENYEYFWNQAWFLNVRTAYGLKGLGLMLKNEKYCEMADKMMNLAINSPMKEGFFPSICIMTTEGIRWIEGTTAFKPHHEYVTVDMALTGYWMLKYADTYDYRKPDILSKLKKSAENLLNLQLESGAFPTTIQVKENRDGSVDITPIKDILYETPGSSAIGMFLCEIYKATGNTKYLNSAKKIVPFLEKEILPINKWFDYETFFSCTDYALKRKKTVFPYSILARDTTRKEEDNFKDPYTLSLPQNTMSIYW
ncbi:MAG: hypothetical protein GY870_15240, partial [archaeon]|nr:hypothetical protein [archaeon]